MLRRASLITLYFLVSLFSLFSCSSCEDSIVSHNEDNIICLDFSCDSLAIRVILDSNGFTNTSVDSVIKLENQRVNELNLTSLQIKTLPKDIGNLSQLEYLWLPDNQLTEIPANIKNLTQLIGLYLQDNQISLLPEGIGQLTLLENLRLDHNQLTTLPPEIINILTLKSLHIRSNQLCNLNQGLIDWANNYTITDSDWLVTQNCK